jgi:hypothetical protein
MLRHTGITPIAGSVGLDPSGAIYVGGRTGSKNFPIKNAFQKSLAGPDDIFISKLAPSGKSLVYSTLLGSSKLEWFSGLAVDGKGSVYVTGTTYGTDFPVKNAFQTKYGGGGDVFITKLASSGKALVYSSFLGGRAYDLAMGVAVDGSGAAYITGSTLGSFPVKNAFQKTHVGSADGFATKVASDGKSLIYSTYLGGPGADCPCGIAADGSGAACIVGYTQSSNWPVKYLYQGEFKGSSDAFLSVLAANGQSLLYSTYLGGRYEDYGSSLALDLKGGIYISGWTKCGHFPLLNPFQKTYAGNYDIFVTKFSSGSPAGRPLAPRTR